MSGIITESDSEAISLPEKTVFRVPIPAGLKREIEASGLRGLAKDEIYWIVSECLTSKTKAAKVNQRVLNIAINSTQRANVIRFIKSSQYIRVASSGSYMVGQRCLSYELTELAYAELGDVSARQDIMRGGDVLVDGCNKWVDGCAGEDVDGERPVCCVAMGNLVEYAVDVTGCNCCVWRSVDFSALFSKVQIAYERLGWNQSVLHAAWSLSELDEPEIFEEDIVCAAEENLREKTGRIVFDDELRPVVEACTRAVARFVDRRSENVLRKDGRTYHSATNLLRKLRNKFVRFNKAAESLDIRACYAWILAARHRRFLVSREMNTSAVDFLMDLIEAGELYSTLAEVAGLPFETEEEKRLVKAHFQQFCLFGKIGWHPLWHALKSICPGVCGDIRFWRNQPGGASRLAYLLQRAEGSLMTDGLLRHLFESGIPGVQFHDGAILPAGKAAIAEEFLRAECMRQYGRACAVKKEVL